MKTVYKYTIRVSDEPVDIRMPIDAEVVRSFAPAPDEVAFWVVLDPAAETVPRAFQVYGTGHQVPDEAKHCATTMAPMGLVWHLFELVPVSA